MKTYTIGVTGHRILADEDAIRGGIERALDHIARHFDAGPPTVLSSLAEGADRLVARAVLERGNGRLIAVLPLPRSDYTSDFASAASVAEFEALLARADDVVEMPPAVTRPAAYEGAGRYVLDRSDVLLAVWDGQPAQGEGGSGAVVVEARRRRIPIAWVHAGNREPGTNKATSLGTAQGGVSFEHF